MSKQRQAASRTKSLGDALDELIESFGIRGKLREQGIFDVWEKAVGEKIASAATPIRIVRGTLIVSVKSGVWRNELNLRKTEILSRLNEAMEGDVVKEIKFQ